jgi:hypothetical protein
MSKMNLLRAGAFAGLLAIPMAGTTAAEPQVVIAPGGLVNIQIVDLIDDIIVNVEDVNVNVAVALNLAANVCNVAVGVIAQDLNTGTAQCDSVVDGTGSIVTINR